MLSDYDIEMGKRALRNFEAAGLIKDREPIKKQKKSRFSDAEKVALVHKVLARNLRGLNVKAAAKAEGIGFATYYLWRRNLCPEIERLKKRYSLPERLLVMEKIATLRLRRKTLRQACREGGISAMTYRQWRTNEEFRAAWCLPAKTTTTIDNMENRNGTITTESADAEPQGQGVALTDSHRGLMRERMYLDGREANVYKRLKDQTLPEHERVLALKHHAAIMHHRDALQAVIKASPLLAELDAACSKVETVNN